MFDTHIFTVVPKFLKFLGALATKSVANEAPPKKLKEGLLRVTPTVEYEKPIDLDSRDDKSTVSITVVGASGDLAKKKIFPALFALYYEDCLPEVCLVFMLMCEAFAYQT